MVYHAHIGFQTWSRTEVAKIEERHHPGNGRYTQFKGTRNRIADHISGANGPHWVPDPVSRAGLRGNTLTAEQCRAARGFLGWTQKDLAHQALVSSGTVRRFETERSVLHKSTKTLLVTAFKVAGVTFTGSDHGIGIFLHRRRSSGQMAN